MNNNQYIYKQPPMGRMMPPPMQKRSQGWRERWMRRFGMSPSTTLLRHGELTIPNWFSGRAMIFFFVAMFACWGTLGYVPSSNLFLTASLSAVLFFYGGMSMSKSWSHTKERAFLKYVYIVGFIVRFLWVIYIYYIFNPDNYGTTIGDGADVEWYMPFGKDLALWLSGNSKYTFSQIMDMNKAAIDDTGYPMWLGIVYSIFGVENDVFIPYLIKCIAGAYCAICIYRVAKRHFGEGTARMAAIFVCLNPNMIYWCGTMMKEAEMVFLCCVFIDEVDKALSTNRFAFKDLWLGLLAGLALFFFRAALGVSAFIAVFAHIVMASNRVMSMGKKIIAGVLVFVTLLVGVGDSLRAKTELMFETAQSSETQRENMEFRAEREGGNKFAEYAGAAVFAPLIFTIPLPTFNQALATQYTQMQLSGGSYIKNILSFFVIIVMLMMLISGEWRRHVFILAYTVGYLAVLVVSSFAQSGRFHMPVMPMLMLFAAYGVQIAKGNAILKKWFPIVLVVEVFVCLVWNWFKLAGRGMV